MTISYTDTGDVRRITINGRFDVGGNDSVATKLQDLSEEPGKNRVIVDLSPLRFLASIGIRAIVASAKAVKARGGKMVLVVPSSSSVMMSIKATGVDQLVPVFGSASEAEKAAASA